jgi:hypothetical protein
VKDGTYTLLLHITENYFRKRFLARRIQRLLAAETNNHSGPDRRISLKTADSGDGGFPVRMACWDSTGLLPGNYMPDKHHFGGMMNTMISELEQVCLLRCRGQAYRNLLFYLDSVFMGIA